MDPVISRAIFNAVDQLNRNVEELTERLDQINVENEPEPRNVDQHYNTADGTSELQLSPSGRAAIDYSGNNQETPLNVDQLKHFLTQNFDLRSRPTIDIVRAFVPDDVSGLKRQLQNLLTDLNGHEKNDKRLNNILRLQIKKVLKDLGRE